MNRRALIAVIVSVAVLALLAAAGAVLMLDEHREEHLAEPPAPPPPPELVGASEDVVVVSRGRRAATKHPRAEIVAIGADGNERWHAGRMSRPRVVSERWVLSEYGQLLDLEDGSVTRVPRDGPITDLGDVLVFARENGAEARDSSDPSERRWRIPGSFGWFTDTFRYPDRVALFHSPPVEGSDALIPPRAPNDVAFLVDAEGEHVSFELEGRARAAIDEDVLVVHEGTLSRVSLDTREAVAVLPDIHVGLVALGGFGDLTIWHESGFSQMEAEFAERTPSRFFAWNPDEPELHWQTSAPHGAVWRSDFRAHSSYYLPDARSPLPPHACWPIHGERTSQMSSARIVRVVCLDLEDGTMTYRGTAGTHVNASARHDAGGTTLALSEDDSVTLIRLRQSPVRAIALGRGSVFFAGDVVWFVEPTEHVTRLAAASPEGPELDIDEVLTAPDPAE